MRDRARRLAHRDQATSLPSWVDFHSHLDLYTDSGPAVAQINELGILTVAAAMDLESWQVLRGLAAGTDLIVPSFGIHPARAGQAAGKLGDPAWRAAVEAALEATPLVGEIGLDAVWCPDVAMVDQLAVFRLLLERAVALDKWAVLHTKGAEAQIADEIERAKAHKVVIHWYSGPEPEFRRLLDLGCRFTFGPETSRNPALADFCRRVPADRLLAETDNPVGEPWLGGSDDSPGLIRRIYADIALARGSDPESTRCQLNANSLAILGIHQ